MFKKLCLASAVLIATTNVASAMIIPYVGASTGVVTNTANATNYRGMPANLFAGLGANIGQNIYLGGEVFLNAATAVIKDNGLKSTYGYAASFIPGIMISDHVLGYLRLGLIRTRFNPSGAGDNTIGGTQAGVGLQTGLMQNWDLRGEYTYTGYNSLSGVSGSPRSDAFNLGLVYKFE